MEENATKKVLDYFRTNIFEAFSAYNAWKIIFLSKSEAVVPKEMAEKYVEVQNYHKNFFITTERALLTNFVLLSLHSFDKRDDSFSLYKVDEPAIEKFISDNKETIKQLTKLRHKLFAHRDSKLKITEFQIPSVEKLDTYFKNLIEFYNEKTKSLLSSTTLFTNAVEVKRDVELLLQNLYRGEKIRKLAISIEWEWEKNPKKACDVI